MKSLKESLLDDEDVLISNTDIPKQPKVNKKDFFTYEQAWYDILHDMDLDSESFEKFMLAYCKDWASGWIFDVSFDDFKYSLIDDYTRHPYNNKNTKQIIDYLTSNVGKENKWEEECRLDLLNHNFSNINNIYQATDFLWGGAWEGAFEIIYREEIFINSPHYKQFYNSIKKYLQMKYQIKFD